MLKLNIGCDASKKEGFIGVYILPLKVVDIDHDLNLWPYPFEDSSVDEIWMDNLLEHLEKPMIVNEEINRISKKSYFKNNRRSIFPKFLCNYRSNPSQLFWWKMI